MPERAKSQNKTRRQYGLWSSPISPVSLARGMSFSNLGWGDDGSLVWLESRSDRGALVVQPPDGQSPRDLNSEYSARGRVGYGGGEFTVGNGQVYFVEAKSGRIYRQPLDYGQAEPVTPKVGLSGSPALSPDGRWLVFVHTYEGEDTLAVVDAEGRYWPQKLAWGDDFYMQPAWHPDSQRLAWISWNFPNMPWDGTFLRMGRLASAGGTTPVLEDVRTVAGDAETSVFQPLFSPDGRYLAYTSDASGWGQIYLYDLDRGEHRQLTHVEAEHGAPAWVQGIRRFDFSPDGTRLFFLRNQAGFITLRQVNLKSGVEERLPLDEAYGNLDQIAVAPGSAYGGTATIGLIASGPATPPRIITFSLDGQERIWRRSTAEELPGSAYSIPQAIHWKGMDGGTVHGLFYPPQNERFEGVGKPPLIVHVHGGPTSQVRNGCNLQAQFFTSRGYAFLEVNYRGSTGYGRAYQDALRGSWGIYDVQDSVSGARSLADAGQVDPERMVIMGGSAGGFTVLKALEDFPGFFTAGVCLYGVANQFNLAADTHKFEARYSDLLLGPLPEAAAIYRERSPIFFVDKIKDPLAVFQGEDDTVVPRNQSDDLVESLQRRGVPHVYHIYPGEGHGFRKTETIEHYYRAVEDFLRQYVLYG